MRMFALLRLGLAGVLGLVTSSPAPCAEPRAFKDVAGRWLVDLDYVHELWKQQKGASYDQAEWEKAKRDHESSAAASDEMKLDEKTLAFFNRGKRNVAYPVLGSQVQGDVVWVDFRHFLGNKMRLGLVREGERLKIVFTDRFWKTFAGYRRAPEG